MGVVGNDIVVLGVERKSAQKLQDDRTVKKIARVDQFLTLAFAGLTADARVLINKARIECQSYRLTVEDAPTVEHVARYIATVQQQYTQRGGRRPFGIATLIGGFDRLDRPCLMQTDPSGTFSEWQADAIGRSATQVKEYLTKHLVDDEKRAEKEAAKGNEAFIINVALGALLEVVESGAKNIEIVVMRREKGMDALPSEVVERLVAEINAEKEKAAEANKASTGAPAVVASA